jgi:hypothetical protein
MTGTTINSTLSIGIKITQSDQNPVVVTAQGTIVTDGNYAIYDATSTAGQITNHGLLDSKSASGTGVEEAAAKSTLTNDGMITAGGSGVYMIGASAVVTNLGAITGQSTSGDGVALANGGDITNGAPASIAGGSDGILIEAYGGTITNNGTISGRTANGIKIGSGNGTIINGASASISGAVYGVVINANGKIGNDGTVTGQSGAGIYIGGTGTVANGDSTHISGLISGSSYGVFTGGLKSAVSNFGTISATANSGIGVALSQGGTLLNGSAASPGGTIHGGLDGVLVRADSARIANYGTITGGDGIGVRIESSSASTETVINGSGNTANFLIGGNSYGIAFSGGGTVRNDGTISAISGAGVYMAGSGTITNGAASQLGRDITAGRYGIYIGDVGNITNFGSISGTNSSGIGVKLADGGTLLNGAAAAKTASVTGGDTGVLVDNGNARLTNFGTILGTNLYGIFIEDNGGASTIVNEAGATIKGVTGLAFGGAGTLTNAGTIAGTGGTAVVFTGADETLVVDPGAVFVGSVAGNATTDVLELAGISAGTLAGFGTQFTGLQNVTLDTGAIWTIETTGATANATHFSGLALADTLDLTGGGSLTTGVSGPGTLQLDGSTAFTLTAGSGLAEALVKIDRGSELTGTGSLSSALLDNGLLAASTPATTTTLHGAVSGAGTLWANPGSTLSVANGFSFAGTLGGGGTILLDSPGTLTAGARLLAVTVKQESNLLLGTGESPANASGHVFDLLAATATQTITLSGATGDRVANAGTLSATGPGTAKLSTSLANTGQVTAMAGHFSLLGAVANTGTISASGGLLAIGTDVSGTGALNIGAASTLWLQAGDASGQTASFLSSTSGTLDLSKPSAFLGHIAGFAGADTIDLIGSAATTLTYSGSTLTVLNGTTKVASLTFNGSYTLADFHLGSDGHSGSVITFV